MADSTVSTDLARTSRSTAAFARVNSTIRIRSGRGIGDSLYLRPIAEHLASEGHKVCALSDYPEIFDGSGLAVAPFSRTKSTHVAHYTDTMEDQRTTQYRAMLRKAGITAEVPLRFAWTIKNTELAYRILNAAGGRPVVLVHGGRIPMERKDGFSLDLIPKHGHFSYTLNQMLECYLVRIGKATNLYGLPVNEDLTGKTSVSDLLDLASVSWGVVAQCSFAVPLAEVFNKPLLGVWSARGLVSKIVYLRTITPAKVLTSPRSSYVVDDWEFARIREAVRAFRLA